MPVGFGDADVMNDEWEVGEGGTIIAHSGWKKRARRFVSTLTWMTSILPEGKPLWGGPCRKAEIEEVYVRPTGGKDSRDDPKTPDAWEKEIGKIGKGVLKSIQTAAFWRGERGGRGHCCQE